MAWQARAAPRADKSLRIRPDSTAAIIKLIPTSTHRRPLPYRFVMYGEMRDVLKAGVLVAWLCCG